MNIVRNFFASPGTFSGTLSESSIERIVDHDTITAISKQEKQVFVKLSYSVFIREAKVGPR